VSGLAICVNGAIVYDLVDNRIVHQHDLPVEVAAEVIVRLRAEVRGVTFGFVRGMAFACEPAYAALASDDDHGRRLSEVPQADALALLDVPPTKLVVRHAELHPSDVFAALSALSMSAHEASLSGAPFVDVVAEGISKASALREIAADLGVGPDEVMAFGDAPNDLQMLRWAGHPVAVANAHPEVAAEIGVGAPSNEDDGVAVAIERMLAAHFLPA
jgi:hydroxymethylpyrimidine pyrophosphatase-like HAD family hydrolase